MDLQIIVRVAGIAQSCFASVAIPDRVAITAKAALALDRAGAPVKALRITTDHDEPRKVAVLEVHFDYCSRLILLGAIAAIERTFGVVMRVPPLPDEDGAIDGVGNAVNPPASSLSVIGGPQPLSIRHDDWRDRWLGGGFRNGCEFVGVQADIPPRLGHGPQNLHRAVQLPGGLMMKLAELFSTPWRRVAVAQERLSPHTRVAALFADANINLEYVASQVLTFGSGRQCHVVYLVYHAHHQRTVGLMHERLKVLCAEMGWLRSNIIDLDGKPDVY